MQPQTVEAEDSKFQALGEKPKWSRPGHTIERNLEASKRLTNKKVRNFRTFLFCY